MATPPRSNPRAHHTPSRPPSSCSGPVLWIRLDAPYPPLCHAPSILASLPSWSSSRPSWLWSHGDEHIILHSRHLDVIPDSMCHPRTTGAKIGQEREHARMGCARGCLLSSATTGCWRGEKLLFSPKIEMWGKLGAVLETA
jgi:hypothetical protein